MGRAVIVGFILMGLVVALPSLGFLTARNSTSTLCGSAVQPLEGNDPAAMVRNAAGERRAAADGSDPAPDHPAPGDSASDPAAMLSGTQLPTEASVPGSSDSTTLVLRGEQLAIAAAIIEEGKSHGIPRQGWVVALATALQESGLHDLDHGDRDSRGVFQQRPSTGWGTIAQVTDIHLSVRAFYGVASHTVNPGLVDIPGWESMPVARAAQAVQLSAFPDAYAKWETTARAIVGQLSGTKTNTTGVDGACVDADSIAGRCPATGLAAEHGLTPDAILVIRCGHEQFPTITSIGGVRADARPDHPSGRAVDLMIPDYQTANGRALGWQVARWMRANSRALGVAYVIFDAKIWNTARDDEGWRPYESGPASQDDTSLHRDHVHVTVFGTAVGGPAGQSGKAGRWVMPLPADAYTVGCSMTCYDGHTGQDFPVAVGTPVRSSNDGTVVRSEALRDTAGSYVSYGNLIVIRVAGQPNMTVWYGHLSTRTVTVGDRVAAGQLIGASGSTGHSDGPHLHYEIRVSSAPVNPMTTLWQNGVIP